MIGNPSQPEPPDVFVGLTVVDGREDVLEVISASRHLERQGALAGRGRVRLKGQDHPPAAGQKRAQQAPCGLELGGGSGEQPVERGFRDDESVGPALKQLVQASTNVASNRRKLDALDPERQGFRKKGPEVVCPSRRGAEDEEPAGLSHRVHRLGALGEEEEEIAGVGPGNREKTSTRSVAARCGRISRASRPAPRIETLGQQQEAIRFACSEELIAGGEPPRAEVHSPQESNLSQAGPKYDGARLVGLEIACVSGAETMNHHERLRHVREY